jgi:hypothetical protein
MNMTDIRKKAEQLGVKAGKMKKTELIREIQKAEGNEPCYGHSNGSCVHADCCFKEDCLSLC